MVILSRKMDKYILNSEYRYETKCSEQYGSFSTNGFIEKHETSFHIYNLNLMTCENLIILFEILFLW